MVKGIISSRQGSQRNQHQDQAIFHIGDHTEIWLIADGATNAKDSGPFISLFCNTLMARLTSAGVSLTPHVVFGAIRSVHSDIRKRFICARGSFLLFIVDPATPIQHCFFLGDCRVGSIKDGAVTWYTRPHSLALANQDTSEQQLCQHPHRHILFRQLTARRFAQPEYLRLSLDLSQPVVMATDGFWSNFPATLPDDLSAEVLLCHLHSQNNPSDDSTVLIRNVQI